MRTSAIDKRAVDGAVFIGVLGLAGDEQADHRYHGGPLKAVYLYASEDLAWWSEQLGTPLAPGFIGENLTTADIDLNALRPGDELHVGDVVLRVTEPRDPCTKLAARVGQSAAFVKRFGQAARTGVYCSVLRTGSVRAGDAIAVVPGSTDGRKIRTVREDVLARFSKH
jgi:MOSC domain-containing protein YiiM